MSKASNLINKVHRRAKNVIENIDSDYKRYAKVDLSNKTAKDSPVVFKLLRSKQRRLAESFGASMLEAKPLAALNFNTSLLDRFDYGGGSYGIRLTLAAAISTFAGFRVGDVLQMLEGTLAGRYLAIVAVTDSTHLRLADVTSFVIAGVAEVTSVTCIADTASSLNSDYFYLYSATNATAYYVWYNVGAAGVDPAIPGKTAIPVSVAANASAATVATATKLAIDALADFVAGVVGPVVTVTNAATGIATNASDTGLTGFTISVTTQGVTASATPSEANITVRYEASSTKQSYY